MKKRMSEKQFAANGQNALKSTGPKTPEGRSVSKMNALKHGIFSKEVLVRGLNFKEDSREFAALHERFWQQYNPVGPVEEMLVDQIVTAQWRLRRALSAESGEIALSLGPAEPSRRHKPNPQTQWLQWMAFGDPVLNMEDSVEGNDVLELSLGEVRDAVERDGELTEAAIQEFVKFFGGKPNLLTGELEKLRLELQKNPAGLEADEPQERNKHRALDFLDGKLRKISIWKADYAKWQTNYQNWKASREQARQAAAVLPSPEVLDKIMRYEAALQRQFYRALAQLERMQRMRQGEAVPAPLMMEVSERA